MYIDDVVKTNILALVRGSGEIFNIASQVPTTDLEVLTLFTQLLGKPDLRPRFADIRPGEIRHIILDISKAQRMLGRRPEVPILEGAERTVAYFRELARTVERAIA